MQLLPIYSHSMLTSLIFPSPTLNSNSQHLHSASNQKPLHTDSEMLKQEVDHFHAKSTWARLCDSCNSVPCTLYCRLDSAYLCTACDTQIHQLPSIQDHERVWVCEACEQAPAAFLCKADAASLCASCDADIHSANPVASRHHRVPILPVGTQRLYLPLDREANGQKNIINDEGDEDDSASWLLLNTTACKYNGTNQGNIPINRFGLEGEVDQFMGLFEFNSKVENQFCNEYNLHKDEFCVPEKNCGGDSVVPVQFGESKENHYQSFLFGWEFETKSEYSFKPSISHTVSVSSLDVGVVPECSVTHSKGSMDMFSGSGAAIQMGVQLSALEREARVMRYREKKKTRRFEKRIRYASRKAYAERRPRIKGRFAKRREVEGEMDEMIGNLVVVVGGGESGYGIVPSL